MELHTKLYIDGRWVDTAQRREVRDPATGKTVERVAFGSVAEARRALQAAEHALPEWSAQTGLSRAELLRQVAALLRANCDEIARWMTLENGKPLAQSLVEVEGAAQHFDWYAEEARRIYGRIVPQQMTGKRHLVLKQPIGVCGIITPWNFPLVLLARKVAPALAAGCTVVAKPASQTPLVALALAGICAEVGLPPGVFNLVTGPANEIGDEFLSNPTCRKISFTGSTEVGKSLMKKAADQVKKLSLELGGHCPVIVFEDADLTVAVEKAAGAKYRNTGQSCIAANRLYVQEAIYERFLKLFVEHSKRLRVGPGLDENSQIGPLIDEATFRKVVEQIENAVRSGARIECGGKQLKGAPYDGGYFVEPTVLTNVRDDMLCMCEETFGPLIPVVKFVGEADVVQRANRSRYGLAAYFYTKDLARAFRVAEALEAGTIGVNDDVPSTTIAPFGGYKESGLGRECGSEGIDAFLETKHVSIVL